MFDKFGEFDTYEEFEEKAKDLLKGADTESIRELAKENGLDPLDAEDYITGATIKITDPGSYAVAKIDTLVKESSIDKQAVAYMGIIAKQVLANKQAGLKAHYKGRRFDKIMDAMEQKVKKNIQNDNNKKNKNACGYACGSDRDMEKIIEAYFFESEDEMKKAVDKL